MAYLFLLKDNSFLVYCRELAPGIIGLTGDWAQGDDSKHDSHYTGASYFYGNVNKKSQSLRSLIEERAFINSSATTRKSKQKLM